MATDKGIALVDRDEDGVDRAFREDVLAGLRHDPKAIPARWFYDAEGSRLFEKITQVEEYYPTRSETEILGARGPEFAELIGPGRAVVEFGSGSSVKTRCCLRRSILPPMCRSIFRAISCARARRRWGRSFPGCLVHPVEADFMRRVSLPDAVAALPKLGFFPGSTIGNYGSAYRGRPAAFDAGHAGRGRGRQPAAADRDGPVKDSGVLESAYDDAEGVTAAFNMNLLTRINRELGGTIPADAFAHEARWNDDLARIEMHLVATRDVAFEVSGERFTMQRGETIHTENSHKFTCAPPACCCSQGAGRRWNAGPMRKTVLRSSSRGRPTSARPLTPREFRTRHRRVPICDAWNSNPSSMPRRIRYARSSIRTADRCGCRDGARLDRCDDRQAFGAGRSAAAGQFGGAGAHPADGGPAIVAVRPALRRRRAADRPARTGCRGRRNADSAVGRWPFLGARRRQRRAGTS